MQALFLHSHSYGGNVLGKVMDTNSTMKWVIAIAATLLVGVSAVKPALADEYLCDATQASTNELPVLKNDCPIGDGLWGKRGLPEVRNCSGFNAAF